ncbi:MAG: hypothetical protein KGL39_45620 [Patescibacteria group bacterium]|nr:hypothetical protein [Patescibacteria group bacterium]
MTIINTLPYTIANGQAVDATPVMADLNQIVSNVNANAVASASLAASGGAGACRLQCQQFSIGHRRPRPCGSRDLRDSYPDYDSY